MIMDLLIKILMCLIGIASLSKSVNGGVYNVVNYGARGDGQSDDSKAFLKAWEAMCSDETTSRQTFRVPTGKTFLLHALKFSGPCKANNIEVQVAGNLVAPKRSNWVENDDTWICFERVNNLLVHGSGTIDGKGSSWWNIGDASGRPTALSFSSLEHLNLQGLRHVNPPRNHLSISSVNYATISGIKMTAPDKSPNTDGIDIAGSTHIKIVDSIIGTGDDCVAINGGASDVNIRNVQCGPGHGISIGSLGKGGATETVEEVLVQNCTFIGSDNGARIKTWPGGRGFARKITFENIRLIDTRNPIIIDQFYCNGAKNCQQSNEAVAVSNVKYINIWGTSPQQEVIQLDCAKTTRCHNIVMQHINITSTTTGQKATAECQYVDGTASSTTPRVPCLSGV